jgi:hypothetical protein
LKGLEAKDQGLRAEFQADAVFFPLFPPLTLSRRQKHRLE